VTPDTRDTVKKIRELIYHPSRYLEEIRNRSFKADVQFFILVTIAGSILMFFSTVIAAAVTGQSEFLNPVGLVVIIVTLLSLFVFNGLFLMLVISLIEHFFVVFTGENRGFERTMKSVIYASVLPVLFFWIPSVFRIPLSALLLAGTFCIATFYGILIFHEKTKDRAAFVALFTTGFILIMLWLGKGNITGNAW
jgi:hypothetical protein